MSRSERSMAAFDSSDWQAVRIKKSDRKQHLIGMILTFLMCLSGGILRPPSNGFVLGQ